MSVPGVLRGPALFVRSRGAAAAAGLLLAQLVVVYLCPRSPVPIPLRQGDGADLVPIALALAPALAGSALNSPDPLIESRVPLLPCARALWWVALLTGFVGLGAAGFILGPGGIGAESMESAWALALRNACFTMGLSTVFLVVFGRDASWAPAIVFLGISAVYGTDTYTGHVVPWALLQRSPDDALSWLVATALAVVGGCWYAVKDRRR